MDQTDLTKGSVSKTLFRFALPFLAATFLQFLYAAVDMIVVGRFSSPAGITAVNTSSQLMQMVTGVITGLTTGGTVLIGQYKGAGEDREVSRTIGNMFTLFTLIAAVLTVTLALTTDLLVDLMQTPEEAVLPARQYLFICACGTFFITGYNSVSGILRGLGDSKRPMYFIAISCILNIIGDLLLVGGFGLGAAGAALATVAAQAVSFLLSLHVLRHGSFPFDFRRSSFGLQADRVKQLLKLGVPICLQDGLVTLSFILITAIVNGIGLHESAAVGAVERIIGFAMLIPIAFLSALSALTAQNMGAGLPDRAKKGTLIATGASLALSLLLFLPLQLVPEQAMGLFTDDGAVIAHGALYLHTYSLDVLLVCFVFCLNGFFAGCGRTTFTMANGLVSTFLVRVPLVFFISRVPGVTLLQIGLAAPAASTVQVAMQLVYLKSGRWKRSLLRKS